MTGQADLQATLSAGLSPAEMDQFTLLQLSLQMFCLGVKLLCLRTNEHTLCHLSHGIKRLPVGKLAD